MENKVNIVSIELTVNYDIGDATLSLNRKRFDGVPDRLTLSADELVKGSELTVELDSFDNIINAINHFNEHYKRMLELFD